MLDLTIINTRRGIRHPEQCLRVQRYSHRSAYELAEDADCDPDATCPLCKHSVTKATDRYAPVAVTLARARLTADAGSKKLYTDAIRTLISETTDRVQEAGYLKENVGASVKSSGDWRSKRSSATDTDEFDRLLVDALEVCLCFDVAYFGAVGYDSWDALLDAGVDGDYGQSCEVNVAKSIQWLSDYHPPIVDEELTDLLQEFGPAGEAELCPGRMLNTGSESESEAQSETESQPDQAVSTAEPSAPSDSSQSSQPSATTLGDF